jgi:hypothetical protein
MVRQARIPELTGKNAALMHKILNEEHTLDYLCGTNTELPEEDGVQLTQVQKKIICTFMLSKILTLPSNFDSFVTFYL